MSIPKLKSKPKYLDAPRFDLIYDYENKIKDSYKDATVSMIKSLGGKMSEFIKENVGKGISLKG